MSQASSVIESLFVRTTPMSKKLELELQLRLHDPAVACSTLSICYHVFCLRPIKFQEEGRGQCGRYLVHMVPFPTTATPHQNDSASIKRPSLGIWSHVSPSGSSTHSFTPESSSGPTTPHPSPVPVLHMTPFLPGRSHRYLGPPPHHHNVTWVAAKGL